MQRPRGLGLVVMGISLVGILVAGYLTVIHYTGANSICAVVHGCEVVQKSDWSKLAGVPVAVLGLIGYVVILASVFMKGEAGLGLGALVALGGFGFSMYLTYREAVSIKAWCMWCVISAILMTLLAIVTVVRLWRAEPALGGHAADELEHEPGRSDAQHARVTA